MSQAEIARHVGVSNVAVSKWNQQLAAHNGDLNVLRAKPAYRSAPRLTAKQWDQLKRVLLKGAIAAGFSSEHWTLPRIQQLVKQRWGVKYSCGWLSIRLRQLSLSVQRPTTVARAKEDALAEAWLRQDWPRIKKAFSNVAPIILADEFAVSFRDRPATT
jgi:putative transposase